MSTKRKYEDITPENLHEDIRYFINKYDITFSNYHLYIDIIVENLKELFDSEKECIDHITYFIYNS
jgi:hypothetical protein